MQTRPSGKGAGIGYPYTNEDLLSELKRLQNELGCTPRRLDVLKLSTIHPDTFERRLGNWLYEIPAILGVPHPQDWSIDDLDPYIGGWIAGFTCGEGYFALSYNHYPPRGPSVLSGLKYSIRDDDAELLYFVRDALQLNYPIRFFSNAYRRNKGEKCGDEVKLDIYANEQLYYKILPLFRHYPLHGKKQREFEIFAQAIEIMHKRQQENRKHQPYTRDEMQSLIRLCNEINNARQHPIYKSSKANRVAEIKQPPLI